MQLQQLYSLSDDSSTSTPTDNLPLSENTVIYFDGADPDNQDLIKQKFREATLPKEVSMENQNNVMLSAHDRSNVYLFIILFCFVQNYFHIKIKQ